MERPPLRPDRLGDLELPRRIDTYPSPGSWQDEVVYFLLVDRFSDGGEGSRPLLDRTDLGSARPGGDDDEPWRWDRWADSGLDRFQGGTIAGVTSRLDYLQRLGVTTVWLSPVFAQRRHLDTYHGYGVQDFLDVDPRFGRREDLVDLVAEAHKRGMRVLLDVIFNHSGANWLYPPDTPGGELEAAYTRGRYPFGHWRGVDGGPVEKVVDPAEGVWPAELQNPDAYTRAGTGNLGSGSLEDDQAEFRRSDFEDLRDFALDVDQTLDWLARCYMYWIAETDCDGFRIDTVKHVSFEQARNFCGTIKEFAVDLGKRNFLLVGEIAGGDTVADRYLEAVGRNLDAALDIGESRLALRDLGRGTVTPSAFFDGFDPGRAPLGSHRQLGDKLLSILDDHDHVFGDKLRFAAGAANDHQAVVPTAIQLFTLGIPCLYYGTEQALAGPERDVWSFLPGWGTHDRYLREAMFGPVHPRGPGLAGLESGDRGLDLDLPGFGPFGTAGAHCFDPAHPVFVRIAALIAQRSAFPVLRAGRQYLRPTSLEGQPFALPRAGELIGWSRLLVDEEALCVVNPDGYGVRGAQIVVDGQLNPPGTVMTVIANTEEAAYGGWVAHPVGSTTPVLRGSTGEAYVEIKALGPSECLVLDNQVEPQARAQ
ncbi:MAG TPA: alpha-amylase family glycosyl hydrolase [Propionibacteriaceae bacterium]